MLLNCAHSTLSLEPAVDDILTRVNSGQHSVTDLPAEAITYFLLLMSVLW